MAIKVFIDGDILGPDEARISVFDRGFLYGDSVYEVIRTTGGRPLDFERHLQRLARSANAIALPAPDVEPIRAAVEATLAAAGNDESYIRIMVTRGAGEIGLDVALADRARLIIIVKELSLPGEDLYKYGVDLRIVDIERTSPRAVDPGVKSGNYLNNILALQQARRTGAHEALMCDQRGRVAEGSSSNIFIVRGGTITTPALEIGLLAGITRRRVIQLARDAGLVVEEGELRPDDVRGAQEAFITSSIRGVLPVARVDGEALGVGAPGPVTRKIVALYSAHLREQASG